MKRKYKGSADNLLFCKNGEQKTLEWIFGCQNFFGIYFLNVRIYFDLNNTQIVLQTILKVVRVSNDVGLEIKGAWFQSYFN